jgi:hypothetical protein
VNDTLLLAPTDVVTTTPTVPLPAGATAVICVDETTLKLLAAVLPNVTAVAPVKFAPVMVTEVPLDPLVGLRLLIVGALVLAVQVLYAWHTGMKKLLHPVITGSDAKNRSRKRRAALALRIKGRPTIGKFLLWHDKRIQYLVYGLATKMQKNHPRFSAGQLPRELHPVWMQPQSFL